MAIKSLLIVEHKIFEEGISVLLKRHFEIEIKSIAARHFDPLTQTQWVPSFVLLEMSIVDCKTILLIPQLLEIWPNVKICVISGFLGGETIKQVFELGAAGYLEKENSMASCIDMIEQVLSGKQYLKTRLRGVEMTSMGKVVLNHQASKLDEARLTPRETEILKHLLNGKRPKEISEVCAISIKTYETHRNNITKKTKIQNLAALTKFALREGVISLD